MQKLKLMSKFLKTQTKIGKINLEFNDEHIRELIVGNYRVIYRIKTADRIDILLVHHGARNLHLRVK